MREKIVAHRRAKDCRGSSPLAAQVERRRSLGRVRRTGSAHSLAVRRATSDVGLGHAWKLESWTRERAAARLAFGGPLARANGTTRLETDASAGSRSAFPAASPRPPRAARDTPVRALTCVPSPTTAIGDAGMRRYAGDKVLASRGLSSEGNIGPAVPQREGPISESHRHLTSQRINALTRSHARPLAITRTPISNHVQRLSLVCQSAFEWDATFALASFRHLRAPLSRRANLATAAA